jgi:hypothetical protein
VPKPSLWGVATRSRFNAPYVLRTPSRFVGGGGRDRISFLRRHLDVGADLGLGIRANHRIDALRSIVEATLRAVFETTTVQELGVRPETISRWKRDPAFIAALDAARAETWTANMAALAKVTSKAIDVAERTLDNAWEPALSIQSSGVRPRRSRVRRRARTVQPASRPCGTVDARVPTGSSRRRQRAHCRVAYDADDDRGEVHVEGSAQGRRIPLRAAAVACRSAG